MRESDINAKKFHLGHYNIISAKIKDTLAPLMDVEGEAASGGRTALIDLSLKLCQRFLADNEEFIPEMFLTRCSPDPDRYPLGDLWKITNENA